MVWDRLGGSGPPVNPSAPAETGPTLSPAQKRRGQHYLVRLSMVFGCTSALVWSVNSLFLLSLGATPFHLGLLETAKRLAMTVRLLAAHLIGRVGKARLMFLGRVGMWVPVAGLVANAALWVPTTMTMTDLVPLERSTQGTC